MQGTYTICFYLIQHYQLHFDADNCIDKDCFIK